MFSLASGRGWGNRTWPGVVWLALPVVLLLWFLRPTPSVIYVSWDPFIISRTPISPRPPGALAVLRDSYATTLVSAGAVIAWAAWHRWHSTRSGVARSVWAPFCFLPTYVFGLDAVRHILAIGRCQYYVGGPVPDLPKEVAQAAFTSGAAFLITVVAGCLAVSLNWKNRIRSERPPYLPAILAAVGVAVAGNWYVLWFMCQPVR